MLTTHHDSVIQVSQSSAGKHMHDRRRDVKVIVMDLQDAPTSHLISNDSGDGVLTKVKAIHLSIRKGKKETSNQAGYAMK